MGRPWNQKRLRVCLGTLPVGTARTKLHICLSSQGHPSSLLRRALFKKLILLGVCWQCTFWEFSGPIPEGLNL